MINNNNNTLAFRHDAQFKRLLIESVPGIEPVLKVLLQEEGNALESVTKTFNQATEKVSDISSIVTGFIGGSKAPDTPVTSLKSEFKIIISNFIYLSNKFCSSIFYYNLF